MHLESKTILFMKHLKLQHKYFYTNKNSNYSVFLTIPPISTLIEQQITSPRSLFSKNNFQFLFSFLATDPFHDARRRRRRSAKQWKRSKGKRLYLAARVSIYPVLSFISIPWKLFRGPFSIGEPIPASFSRQFRSRVGVAEVRIYERSRP